LRGECALSREITNDGIGDCRTLPMTSVRFRHADITLIGLIRGHIVSANKI
jgi:hypothetical protein